MARFTKARQRGGIKQFAVVVSATDNDITNTKTAAHEIELHLKNEINYVLTKDEKYNKSPEKEHVEGFGEEYYERTGSRKTESPLQSETPPNSKMGKIYKRIDNVSR